MKFKTVTPLPNPPAPVCPPNASCPPRNLTFNIWGLGGGSGDPIIPEYKAILDYATTQGWALPSAPVQDLQNTFLELMIGHGIWADLDVFYNFLTDGDANFAKINWRNPGTFQAITVGTPTYTSLKGFSTVGGANYLNTQWKPNEMGNKIAINNGAIIYDIYDIANNGYALGAYTPTATERLTVIGKQNDGNGYIQLHTGSLINLGTVPTSYFAHGQSLSTQQVGWVNGISVYNNSYTPGVLSPVAVFLLNLNNNGAALAGFSGGLSMFGAGASLTGKEADLFSEWASYKSGIGEFKAKNVYPFEMT